MQTIAITMINMNIAANTSTKYEVDGRCMDCQFKSFERLMQKFSVSDEDRQTFFEYYNITLARNPNECMPEIHRLLNKKFCEIIKINDPYAEEKILSNNACVLLYSKYRKKVLAASNPFDKALRLAIAGNIIDYGASHSFDIDATIHKVLQADFAINHSVALEQGIKKAKKILYLGDNAGEIVFDKLFIELIMHPNITFAVRGAAVLNDATVYDAQLVGMDMVADVISNGYDSPSTILSECSDEFRAAYNEADLIISKGQGNYEGLMLENDPRIYFLLMIKCDVVADTIGVQKGDFVVYNKMLKN